MGASGELVIRRSRVESSVRIRRGMGGFIGGGKEATEGRRYTGVGEGEKAGTISTIVGAAGV